MKIIDIVKEKDRIVRFIRSYLSSSGFEKGVIGVSGGLDSAVVAALSVEALGRENVLGLVMPYKQSDPKSLDDALSLQKMLGFKYRIIDITPMIDAWFDNYEPEASPHRRGNYMARIRMTILFDYSAKENALVIGTGNLSEIMTGYSTQFGDNACAFEPIGHLYKTEVRELAKMLDIPATIVNKEPSADLWSGQTDESELGISYESLDKILYYHLERKLSRTSIVDKGFSEEEIDKVIRLYSKSSFKRMMPPTLERYEGLNNKEK